MEYPKIVHLYKYYSYNANSLSVLINKRVWFSKPSSLNDPFDLGIDFVKYVNLIDFNYMIEVCKHQVGISRQRKHELDEIQELEKRCPDPHARVAGWEEANKKLREDLRNSGVFCMSELNDNILMWTHYSDRHKGFCVEFVRTPQNQLGNIQITNPVIYKCQYPSPSPFSEESRKRSFDDLFLTKSIEWSYEKEWRLINEVGDIALPLPGDISAIIFGLKMSSENRKTIMNILSKDFNIIYRQVEKVPDSFKLKIVDCKSNN